MKKTLLSSLLFLASLGATAQKEADNWYFGVNAGVSFSTGSAVTLTTGVMNAPEGCAAISNSSGALLFYTDGVSVWNKNNVTMPNGLGLLGGNSTQSAVIVPKPGSNTLYYIFTIDEDAGVNGLSYSVVDMSLQAGLGNVTTAKNVAVLAPVTERITAVKDASGNYWIAVHQWNTNAFNVYQLTSAGLQAPVVTNIGIKHSKAKVANAYGQMKFNPCGNRLAVAAGYLDTVQVFDFNSTTGVLSNALTLPFPAHVYGIEFSENSSRLYVSNYDANATLVQYDLTLGTAALIKASKTTLSTTPDIYSLQLANNGKIYAAVSFNQFLAVINNPNTVGTGCSYVDQGLDLDPGSNGTTSGLGLPGFVQSYFKISLCTTGIDEAKEIAAASIYPNPFKEQINVLLNISTEALVTIYTPEGKTVLSETITGGKLFNTASFAKGMYFVNVKTINGENNFKVVK